MVISDLCEKIINLKDVKKLFATLSKVLNEWSVFFEKHQDKILSISHQKGLVGELHFLKDFLFQKYSVTEAVQSWTGSDRANHDFQLVNDAVEVKTTASKQHKKFKISSEKQLDSTGLEHLYLSLFSINIHKNTPNLTLPALIRKIYKQIHDDPIATFQFQIKLAKYGYNEALAEKYTVGFSVSEVTFFEVLDGFPRLLNKDLPTGVGDLKYSVVVAACIPFEITTNILTYI